MPRYVGKPLDAKVHVIDANGDPVTGASVSVKVLDPSGSDWDGTWSAIYLSDGIYHSSFTPDEEGDWTVIFSSANPKFTKAFIYHVSGEDRMWEKINNQINQISDPTTDLWYTVCDLEGILQLEEVSIVQVNSDSATKTLAWRITDEYSSFGGQHEAVPSSAPIYLVLQSQGTFGFVLAGEGNGVLPAAKQGYETDDADYQHYHYTKHIERKRFKLEIQINTANSANQFLTGAVTVNKKGTVIDNLD